ncbi:hypothetical protein [Stenotrophomonas sp. CFBP 13725]|uniref:hypothetical protein n=1 Tax=Stenotrophomonas sp. CFBP 13725 TaxID=2775297 RepID=UPI0017863A14|nr:hypothetical protein [Stenotrophomonas sp. CFBP 13725]MBD8636720.1 hypothetical protein [Stenotrophomonas sp. CFBP 13725]
MTATRNAGATARRCWHRASPCACRKPRHWSDVAGNASEETSRKILEAIAAQPDITIPEVAAQAPRPKSLIMVAIALPHCPHQLGNRNHELFATHAPLLLGKMDSGLPGLEVFLVEMRPGVLQPYVERAVFDINLFPVRPFAIQGHAKQRTAGHTQGYAHLWLCLSLRGGSANQINILALHSHKLRKARNPSSYGVDLLHMSDLPPMQPPSKRAVICYRHFSQFIVLQSFLGISLPIGFRF